MTANTDPREAFESIVGAGQYMTLATADASGLPWASPVWFATIDFQEFFWISSPDARHSQNLAVRSELALSIYDSRQPPMTGLGVYVSAIGIQVPESELADALSVYADREHEVGISPLERSDVLPPAKHRMYRATATERYVLGSGDTRVPVP